MLVSHSVHSGLNPKHGSGRVSLAELRQRLAEPSMLEDGHRQRLLELVRRLSHVRAVGNEYARLSLSEHVMSAMDSDMVTG